MTNLPADRSPSRTPSSPPAVPGSVAPGPAGSPPILAPPPWASPVAVRPPAPHPRLDKVGRVLIIVGGLPSAFFLGGAGFVLAIWSAFGMSMASRNASATPGPSGTIGMALILAGGALPLILFFTVWRGLEGRVSALVLLAVIGAVAPVADWLTFDLGVSQVLSWGYLLVPPVVMTLGAVLRLTARIRVRGS